MTLQRLKMLFSISATVIIAAVLVAFMVAPYLGSFYLAFVGTVGTDLPTLTCDFALPLLRIDPLAPSHYPATSWWVSVVWGLAISAPGFLLIWSLKAETTEECMARWISGMSLYLPIIIILTLTMISGLVIAIAPSPLLMLP